MIKSFKIFNESKQSNEDIRSICDILHLENYTINDDGTIDVDGDVNLSDMELTTLLLNFRNVTGFFDCKNNELTTLEGSPKSVGGDFGCSSNKLTNLKRAPQSVGGDFYCYNNKLITLNGAPKSVGGDLVCYNNKLISLEGAPQSIGRDFYCSSNPIYKWWVMINIDNKHDIETFFDFNIDCNDPDDINQEKIDMINNG